MTKGLTNKKQKERLRRKKKNQKKHVDKKRLEK